MLVSIALVQMFLRDGIAAMVVPTEKVPSDLELVEVEFSPALKRRGVVALTFASSEWPEGKVEEWAPRFERKGGDSAAHRQG